MSIAMRPFKLLVIALAAAFVLLLAFALRHASPFATYVCSPVPASVRVVTFKSNDWLAVNPEPVCYLGFTVSAGDLVKVIQQGNFRPVATNQSAPVPLGPRGWVMADQIGPNGRAYTRSHSPAARAWLPLGRNRGWTEFLWIDATGTNAYFLLWGV
jgi:hypothetical protein